VIIIKKGESEKKIEKANKLIEEDMRTAIDKERED